MQQPPVLTLIDASGFIFRAYHAIQHLSTSKGVPTNAVYGFTRMILKTLKDLEPTHIALAFDKESRQGRQAIDPNYKAHREGPPPDLVPQFDLIRKVVAALNLPVVEVAGWEADDVLGVAVLVAWLAVATITRYSSLAAIVAALFAPVATWHILGAGPVLAAVVAMSVLLVARHHANIAKLARGEESRIGQKKKEDGTPAT